MRPGRRLLTGLLAALAATAGAAFAPVRAQVPAAERWQSIESAHFRVTFTAGLEPLARRAAAAAERARSALERYLADPPPGRTDIVLSDNVDYSNGSASPFPTNRVYLYAKPPVDLIELNYLRDWLELVLLHELAHVFHLDATSRLGALLRAGLGRLPAGWPVFPAIGSPDWAVEGLAVAVESGLTPAGRLHGTWHDMVARTAALEGSIDDIDRLGSSSPAWPGPQRTYIYGSLFLRELQEQHGEEAVRALVQATASARVPPVLWYDRVGRRAFGTGFRAAYRDWRERSATRYRALADTLRAGGLTGSRSLVSAGGFAWYPRYSPDGRWLAYAHDDRRGRPELRVVDAVTGAAAWAVRRNGLAVAAWLAGDTLLGAQLQFSDRDHLFYRLERVTRGSQRELPGSARLQDVAVAPGGRSAVAVENGGGTNRLVRLDPASGASTPLVPFDPAVHWLLPRISPAGDLVAAARWQAGGRLDVVVLDTLGRVLEEITDGTGVNTAPAWTPDGRFVVFASDRTGISNLYAFDRWTRRLAQLTNTLTGAFYPDVSPDGGTIAFSSYHHDGFHIETMPFDTAAFRVPAPVTMPRLPLAAPAPDRGVDAGAVRPYRASGSLAPHYWAPFFARLGAGTFLGAGSSGTDLVGRHGWSALLALAPSHGRILGEATYEYRGLAPLAATALQPTLHLAAARDWDRISDPPPGGGPYVEEREDLVSAGARLLHRGYRATASVGFSGELVRRRRLLMNGAGRRLLDPGDELLGVRLSTSFGTARGYPFSISTEDGVSVQLGVRQRWDQAPHTATDGAGEVHRYDGTEREWSAWSAAYRPLGRVSFAHAVLALRASALQRSGPGASTHGVGGSSGGTFPLGGLLDIGASRFLPVRGFEPDSRRGTSAWSASAELRLPLAMLQAGAHPLPLYLDRLSLAVFADAGDASCTAAQRCDPRRLGSTLVATGTEARLHTSVFGATTLFRLGAAAPLHGGASRTPRLYLQLGPAF